MITCTHSRSLAVFSALALGLLGSASVNATTVFTDSAAFAASLVSSDTEDFSSYTQFTTIPFGSSLDLSGNGFSYSISQTGSESGLSLRDMNAVTGNGYLLSASSGAATLVIDFTSGNVSAVGGNFIQRLVSAPRTITSDPVVLTLVYSDNSTFDYPSYTVSDFDSSFRGFTSPQGLTISQLLFSYIDNGITTNYIRSVDNLIVGVAVIPEPSTFATLGGLAVLAFAGLRRRK